MLFKKTIDPSTLELLKKIMIDPNVEPFALAGGTALALLIGHRSSVDPQRSEWQDEDFHVEISRLG